MEILFYNVKKREKVAINSEKVTKEKFERKTKSGAHQVRYALKAIDDDGVRLTKFCSKSDWQTIGE